MCDNEFHSRDKKDPLYRWANPTRSEHLKVFLYTLERLAKLESLVSKTSDPLTNVPKTVLERALLWLGWGILASLGFSLAAILNSMAENTKNLLLIALLGPLIGFLGWIIEMIRRKMSKD